MRHSNSRRFQRNKKQNSPLKFSIVYGVVFLFIILQGYYYNYAISTNNTTINIEINDGQTIQNISDKLKELNIIQSKFLFKRHLVNKGLDKQIKTGVFEVPTQISIPNLAQILIQAPTNTSKVTIIEGEKIKNIEVKYNFSNLNNCLTNCNLDNFFQEFNINPPKTLEGFLFPDTYFIPQMDDQNSLVKKATDNFTKKVSSLDIDYNFKNIPVSNFYEVLIVASLIEKEVILDKDKALVSGIIYKRLENDWTLGIDAALLYEKNNNIITRSDLDGNSEYNLRKFKGLPPTPICNPSLSSIKAALNPESSEYWFYLTKPITNDVVYSVTNEQHNQNKRKYLN